MAVLVEIVTRGLRRTSPRSLRERVHSPTWSGLFAIPLQRLRFVGMEIFLSALLSAVFATVAVLWAERHKDRARARNQLQQIRADIMRADRDARAYCTKAQDVVERSRPMPSYRMPTSSWALLSYLHASGLLTDVERERIEDWFHYAEQMNRAMDKGFPVVARQKAERLVNPDIGGHSRTELATAAIAEALSRLG